VAALVSAMAPGAVPVTEPAVVIVAEHLQAKEIATVALLAVMFSAGSVQLPLE